MADLPDFKRGSTFQLGLLFRDSTKQPEDLTGKTIRSQLRGRGNSLTQELTVSVANQTTNPGEASLYASPTATTQWKLGDYELDIKVTVGSQVAHSETMLLTVIKSQTE